MKRFFLLGPMIFILLFVGLFARTREPLAFLMPLLAYIGAGVLFRPERPRIRIEREMSSDRVSRGEPVEIRLKVVNEGPRLEELMVEDTIPKDLEVIKGSPGILTTLDQGESLDLVYSIRAGRGSYQFREIKLTVGDYLGLFLRHEKLHSEGRVTVLPHSMRIKSISIRPRRTRTYSGLIPSRTGGRGVSFFGVREYRDGDPPRLINWTASARHPRAMFTNEFEQERVADVGLILDARQRSYGGINEEVLFENVVSATAAVAEALLNDGNRVGLYNYGRIVDWTFPGYGRIQKERILSSLIRARLGKHLVFDKLEYLPIRLFPASSQLIFISPLQNDDRETLFNLRARGYQILVISPDRISFELEQLTQDEYVEIGKRIASLERLLILNELRQAGIQVLDWSLDVPFHHLMGSYSNRQASLIHFRG